MALGPRSLHDWDGQGRQKKACSRHSGIEKRCGRAEGEAVRQNNGVSHDRNRQTASPAGFPRLIKTHTLVALLDGANTFFQFY